MQGYSWGEQPSDARTLKLNTNENPYPPTPAVQEALQRFDAARLRRYPQPTADAFRDRVAQRFALERGNVLATNGGDELLRLAFTTFLDPGDTVGMAEPSYSLYPVLAEIHGCRIASTPLDDDWALPADFAQRMNDAGARLTCLVCPHAPSGALTSVERLRAIAEEIEGVLIIDEAYVDFVDPQIGHDAVALLQRHDNLLLLRSLSKGYSLAGLRFGFGLGARSLIAPMLTKTRDSYNVDTLSQELAEAAFADERYAAETWAAVRRERRRLHEALAERGLGVVPSQSNFLLARLPAALPLSAQALYEALRGRGILVRHLDQPHLADKLRITIGDGIQNDRLLAALDDILAS